MEFESATDPEYPRRWDHVRVGKVHGHWTLEQASGGKVAMTYVIYSEPGGHVPAFLAERGLRNAAIDFVKLILARAGK